MDLEVAIERLEVIGAIGQERLVAYLADGSVRFLTISKGPPQVRRSFWEVFPSPSGERYLQCPPRARCAG